MKALFLSLLALGQDPSSDVDSFVKQGAYLEALAAAEDAEGPLRSLLVTWARHHAGDLHGALAEASVGLKSWPEYEGLLEQAAWLSASLHRGAESMEYAQRLKQLGHPSASAFISDAEEILAVADEVSAARERARGLLAAFALLAVLGSWWGTRPATP